MLMFGCLILPLGAFLLTSKLKLLLKCLPPIQELTRPALAQLLRSNENRYVQDGVAID